ncbi:MAG TPA: dynamin family protein, partial [Vicinamibacterales bacterium]|nr:dynamin family protein [Vicinamibacterales bacterium]
MGTIPVTSAVTSLRYGSTLRVTIKRARQAIDEQIPVSALPDFITERGNPGNQKHVLAAEIEVPTPFLRRGLHFIDTPGIGSAHEHNTATTLNFLPEADAAIFVTGADGPLSDVELQFLDAVRQHVRKLFFVLNKIDQLGSQERDEALSYTAQLLSRRLGGDAARVFPFSAAQALAAGRTDAKAATASGLHELQSALATFLNDERRTVFLVAVLDRAVALLEHVRFMLDARQEAIKQTSEPGNNALAELAQRLDDLERDRQGVIARVRQRVSEWRVAQLEPALGQFSVETHQTVLPDLSSLVEAASATSRDYYARGDECLRADLQDRATTWLRAFADRVNEFADKLGRDASHEISPILQRPDRVVAAMLGVTQPRRSGQSDPSRSRSTHAPFDPPTLPSLSLGERQKEVFHGPIPRVMATRLAVRRLSQRLPHYVERTVTTLREMVLDYLKACVDVLDRSSEDQLAMDRKRIDAVVKDDAAPEEGRTIAPSVAMNGLQELLARMTALRDGFLSGNAIQKVDHAPAVTPADALNAEAEQKPVEARSRSDSERVVTGTCAICAVAADAVFDFLCEYQYAIGRDGATRNELLASRGLCPTHTWHLERLSSPRGLSLAYPVLLDEIEERVKAIANLPRNATLARVHELTRHAGTCPACLAREKAEQRAAVRLAEALRTVDGRSRFERSQWLCLPHLELVLTGVDSD